METAGDKGNPLFSRHRLEIGRAAVKQVGTGTAVTAFPFFLNFLPPLFLPNLPFLLLLLIPSSTPALLYSSLPLLYSFLPFFLCLYIPSSPCSPLPFSLLFSFSHLFPYSFSLFPSLASFLSLSSFSFSPSRSIFLLLCLSHSDPFFFSLTSPLSLLALYSFPNRLLPPLSPLILPPLSFFLP
jgi:hypothetical protein